MGDNAVSVDECYHGFREDYLGFETLTRQLEAWADAFPDFVRLTSLGRTPEGRDIWLLTVAAEPDRVRPAVWVDGNMHSGEVSGSSVALAIAEAALRLHVDDAPPVALPAQVLEVLRGITFHVCPRMSPDGAERVLTEGGFVRSVPRAVRGAREEPHWEYTDVDGDGVVRYMRVEDPAGEFVASAEYPGLMLPRRLHDPPPWYRVYREGVIRHWDGHTVPEPEYLANTVDLNRNFPWDWAPEPEQVGAGAYPGSEPESQAVLAWTSRHPELYAWLNLHTFGGVFIRPLGHQPDSKMDRGDLALYRQLAAWGEELVGYPTVSGFEEFTYEPEKPLHGDLTDYAYNHRGCLAEVCELWDLFARLDLPQPRPFVHRYTALERDHMRALAAWDKAENHGRVFGAWQAFDHPQLGAVEIGGPDPLVGLWNPPYEHLPELCQKLSEYWLRVAALLPRLVVEDLRAEAAGEELFRVTAVVANHGYLPTWGLDSSRERPWNGPVYADLAVDGCALDAPGEAHREVGHLRGWGRGLGQGADSPMFMRSAGNELRRTLTWLVRGGGTVTLRAGNARVGWVEETVTVGA
ncbi:MAG: M14 family metallopeptidase [Halofilum sp. (in: g-proteobacteria)]|nr:M14 family metallopeptidase [Halofilum sp. (in: g-proteobacteria)]